MARFVACASGKSVECAAERPSRVCRQLFAFTDMSCELVCECVNVLVCVSSFMRLFVLIAQCEKNARVALYIQYTLRVLME